MEEYHPGDEVVFNPDEASNCIKECIESIIGGVDYSQNKVNQWTASIVEHSLTQLVKQGKPFKYIVNCAVMQKSGAGLHTASSCYWDTTTDGSCTVRWENRTMYCVVSVFAVAVSLWGSAGTTLQTPGRERESVTLKYGHKGEQTPMLVMSGLFSWTMSSVSWCPTDYRAEWPQPPTFPPLEDVILYSCGNRAYNTWLLLLCYFHASVQNA